MASGNQFQQWQQGADDAVYMLIQFLGYIGNVNTQYLKEYGRGTKKFGSQVQVAQPPRFAASQGDAITLTTVVQPEVVVTVQPPINVAFPITDEQMALFVGDNIDQWDDERHQFLTALCEALAAQIDLRIALQARDTCPNLLGTPGTSPSTLANIIAGTARMDVLGIPSRDRALLLDPIAHSNVMVGLSANFVQRVIDAAEMEDAVDFPIAGYRKIVKTNSAPVRTVGTITGTPVINGNSQQGSSLLLRGLTPNTDFFNVGDVIQVAGVNAVNPYTRLTAGFVATFCVAGPTNLLGTPVVGCQADGNGNMLVPLTEPINPPIGGVPQNFQNVDSFPVDGATVTILSGTSGVAYKEGLALFKDSLGFATLPQAMHRDAEYCAMSEHKGVELRMWVQSDISNNRKLFRADILPAFATFRPGGMARITS